MKSCRSGFEPVILRLAGSIAMVPNGCVTLSGSDYPMTDGRAASRNTQGVRAPEEVIWRRPTRVAALRVSGNGGGQGDSKKGATCYALALGPERIEPHSIASMHSR
jgi:hypothetical protein